ncbi:unnamed protein product [Protopolystoma xenopodis]|uniref:Uncharacterized protein n=1 Tax=Protopolystoma xenopodis TaxID=117903 RepID=A0A3S5FDD7_9PLAT|nr:unnamed protein product [Protopolystoma xenopodis]
MALLRIISRSCASFYDDVEDDVEDDVNSKANRGWRRFTSSFRPYAAVYDDFDNDVKIHVSNNEKSVWRRLKSSRDPAPHFMTTLKTTLTAKLIEDGVASRLLLDPAPQLITNLITTSKFTSATARKACGVASNRFEILRLYDDFDNDVEIHVSNNEKSVWRRFKSSRDPAPHIMTTLKTTLTAKVKSDGVASNRLEILRRI